MTTIARRKNIIACDSRFVSVRGHIGCTGNINTPKLFIHETQKAVVAISGFCSNPEFFRHIQTLIGQMIVDQPSYPNGKLMVKASDVEEYIKEQKLTTYNFTVVVASPILTTLLTISKTDVMIQYYRPHEDFVVGTGQLVSLLVDPDLSAVETVKQAMLTDDQSGGTVFYVDLKELENVK